MDFHSNNLDREVQLQTQMDPKGETQQPNPTYFEQVGNAFSSERLLSHDDSEHVQTRDFYDNAIKDINATDDEKEAITSYSKSGKMYEPFIDDLVKNGELSFENGNPMPHTDKAQGLVDRFYGDSEALRGYALAKKYNLGYDKVKPQIVAKTREKYMKLEKTMDKDPFFTNFGSQFVGATASWFADWDNVTSLAGEVGALKLINPLFKLTKSSVAMEKYLELGYTSKAVQVSPKPAVAQFSRDMWGKVQDRVLDTVKNKSKNYYIQRIGIGGGVEATANMLGEGYRQSLSYNFHNEVLPEYDLFEVSKNIGIVSVFGSASGALSAHMSNRLLKTEAEKYIAKIPVKDNNSFGIGATTEVVSADAKDSNKPKPKDETPLDSEIKNMSDEEVQQHTHDLTSILDELKVCVDK